MAWYDRLLGRSGEAVTKDDLTSGVSNPESWFVSLLGGGPTVSGIPVSPDRAMANPTVAACVRFLSEDIARMVPVLYSGTRRGAIRKEITDHPAVIAVSQRPNDWMTPFDYWRFHQMNYLLEGNHFDVVLRNNRGDITDIIAVPRGRTTIYQAPEGDLFYGVARSGNHEMAELRNMPLMIPSAYVMHDRGPTRDGIYGQSVIGWHRESIGLALAADDHAARTFSAGARPSGVLQLAKSLNDIGRKRLKAEFDEYRGQAGALRTILLEEGMEFKPVTMNNRDVQFIEGRRMQVAEIARMFGIPRAMLSDFDSPMAERDTDQVRRGYVNMTLLQHVERLEALMNLRLLTEVERGKMFFEFDLTRLTRGDLKSRYEAYALGRQWGVLSVDDIRNAENMNPVPVGGDERLRPLNMVPLGTNPELLNQGGGDGKPAGPGTTAPNGQPASDGSAPDPNAKPNGAPPKKSNGHDTETDWLQ